jgi:hypothetical protein
VSLEGEKMGRRWGRGGSERRGGSCGVRKRGRMKKRGRGGGEEIWGRVRWKRKMGEGGDSKEERSG